MPAVSVQSLYKTYPGTRKSPPVEAVKGISFEVETGEFMKSGGSVFCLKMQVF